jgi:hypothetical protein
VYVKFANQLYYINAIRFLHAPHSRASLRISRTMLNFLFSYHQVMPALMDFIFPFGKQIHAEDFYFSGFREESRLDPRQRGLQIMQLGRSGKEIRICYNLRSVEELPSKDRPAYSIRQSAMYHSFDLETGQSLWINVKGNKLIRDRVTDTEATIAPASKSRSEAFSASLNVHLLFCDWSVENWRWYINDLESQLQDLLGHALATPIDKPPSPAPSPDQLTMSPRCRTGSFSPISRRGTAQSPTSPRNISGAFSPTAPSRSTTLNHFSNSPVSFQKIDYDTENDNDTAVASNHFLKGRLSSIPACMKGFGLGIIRQAETKEQPTNHELQPFSSSIPTRLDPPELPPSFSRSGDEMPQEDFTFSNLQ